jgi:hypothetical protein
MKAILDGIRGTMRLGTPVLKSGKNRASFDLTATTAEIEPSWLEETRKLIPGEALAGYLSLQPIAKAAAHPQNVKIVLAIVFLVVTVVLRWYGTQDPTSADPSATAQIGAVAISALSYIFLVYSTGGQLFWHRTFSDQQLYAEISTAALGILGPSLFKRLFKKQ